MSPPIDFGFYAPSGAVTEAGAVSTAVANLIARGHRVVVDDASHARFQRFAGDDDARIAAIERIAAREDVDVAVAIRGGYGYSRLLDRLDFAALAASGKRWLGHSDFTAFQLAAFARAGLVTFAGPMAAYDFGAETPSEFTFVNCFNVLNHDEYEVEVALEGPGGVELSGTLWGGNLTLLAHLVGTPYFPPIEQGILFIEDTSEHPYRIERMLHQLHYAGVLARQGAILFGDFAGYALHPHDDGYDLDGVVAYFRARLDVPIYTGLPFGHVRDKLTLPFGGRATLVAGDGRATLVLRHPLRPRLPPRLPPQLSHGSPHRWRHS